MTLTSLVVCGLSLFSRLEFVVLAVAIVFFGRHHRMEVKFLAEKEDNVLSSRAFLHPVHSDEFFISGTP